MAKIQEDAHSWFSSIPQSVGQVGCYYFIPYSTGITIHVCYVSFSTAELCFNWQIRFILVMLYSLTLDYDLISWMLDWSHHRAHMRIISLNMWQINESNFSLIYKCKFLRLGLTFHWNIIFWMWNSIWQRTLWGIIEICNHQGQFTLFEFKILDWMTPEYWTKCDREPEGLTNHKRQTD